MIVEYKDTSYQFHKTLPFKKVQKIIEKFDKPVIAKNVYWWYRKSEFGLYFLKKIMLQKYGGKYADLDIDKKDWYLFVPVLKSYFPTITEHQIIRHNLLFFQGLPINPIEDTYFLRYVMMKEYAVLNLKELENLNYKDYRMLYSYSIGQLIMEFKKREISDEQDIQSNRKGYEKFRSMLV